MIKDILLTPLKKVESDNGSVLHAMKNTDQGFSGFGEGYFSEIYFGKIKAWKRHKEMTLNLIVPVGKVKFVFLDNRDYKNNFQEVILSKDNYFRLTVPPMIWFGFQGLSEQSSIILNLANLSYHDDEIDRKEFDQINYNWKEIQ